MALSTATTAAAEAAAPRKTHYLLDHILAVGVDGDVVGLLGLLGAHLLVPGVAHLVRHLLGHAVAVLPGDGLALGLVLGLVLGLALGAAGLLVGGRALLGDHGVVLGAARWKEKKKLKF